MKYCSDTVSRKISVLSTIATVAVVIIHSNELANVRNPSWAFWVGRGIAYLQEWAVPFFFVVSGFFFDRFFCGKLFWSTFPSFLKRKLRSLFIPYVLWGGVYGFILMTPLTMSVNWQHGEPLLAHTIFAAHSIWNVIDRFAGITGGNFVQALWYVKVLLIVFVTAPFWVGIRKLSRWLILATGLFLVLNFSAVSFAGGDYGFSNVCGVHVHFGGIGWVMFGMAASAFRVEGMRIPKSFVTASGVLYLVMTCIVIVNRFHLAPWDGGLRVWFRIAPLFLIATWWGCYDYAPRLLPDKLPTCFSMNFWTYCMHHPITGYSSALFHALFGRSLLSACIYQVFGWILVLTVCLLCGFLVKRISPSAFAVMTGGRIGNPVDSGDNKRA